MIPKERSILQEGAAIQSLFLQAVDGPSPPDLEQRCCSFFARAQGVLDAGGLPLSSLASLQNIALRIAAVSRGFAAFDQESQTINSELNTQSRAILDQYPPTAPLPPAADAFSSSSPTATRGDPISSTPDDALAAPYRLWFLKHFANPYPQADDKIFLLSAVPSHNKQQLDTWFTNNRRRSGWQALKRAHTNGSAEDMERLLREVEEGRAEEEVVRKVGKVKSFFEEGNRDRVRETIMAIVRNGPPKSATRRRVETRANRRVGASSTFSSLSSSELLTPPSLSRAAPYSRTTTPPRRRTASHQHQQHQPNFTTTSPLQTPALEVGYPRYPSTFSPTSSSPSSRTASSSSSSSFDSLISYAPSLPLPTPSSPPASSSLLSFAGPPSSPPSAFPQPTVIPHYHTSYRPPRPHPAMPAQHEPHP
ncbi:hypothetical protein JCM8547_006992 [Rhodosporidiobolus lusitaniae]